MASGNFNAACAAAVLHRVGGDAAAAAAVDACVGDVTADAPHPLLEAAMALQVDEDNSGAGSIIMLPTVRCDKLVALVLKLMRPCCPHTAGDQQRAVPRAAGAQRGAARRVRGLRGRHRARRVPQPRRGGACSLRVAAFASVLLRTLTSMPTHAFDAHARR